MRVTSGATPGSKFAALDDNYVQIQKLKDILVRNGINSPAGAAADAALRYTIITFRNNLNSTIELMKNQAVEKSLILIRKQNYSNDPRGNDLIEARIDQAKTIVSQIDKALESIPEKLKNFEFKDVNELHQALFQYSEIYQQKLEMIDEIEKLQHVLNQRTGERANKRKKPATSRPSKKRRTDKGSTNINASGEWEEEGDEPNEPNEPDQPNDESIDESNDEGPILPSHRKFKIPTDDAKSLFDSNDPCFQKMKKTLLNGIFLLNFSFFFILFS